ncbi:MAG: CRISPR-associated endonuclease Cas1 [Spirochaetaceae bacterium]|nr:CRISPR-associated endonuclease Cas1 [Spirochaetaceae bacterium]
MNETTNDGSAAPRLARLLVGDRETTGDKGVRPRQGELSFPIPGDEPPLVPARMVNEYAYCPRLAYLEWVQGEWAESADTVEGSHAHRRVDRGGGTLPDAGDTGDSDKLHARSVTLSSERLGLIARMDLIEAEDGRVVPVDYKRGKRPHVNGGAYEPERVQLCVQGLILRDQGYRCEEGVLYFVAGRERVRVPFDDELVAATEDAVSGLRRVASEGVIPPPLEDSPKCPRCSLVSICLPDEINHLSLLSRPELAPRPISVPGTDALPLYVQARGAKVAKSGENLVVSVKDEKVTSARLPETSQVVLMGSVYVTTPCLQELMWRGIPVTWHSHGGWFYGHTQGNGHKNVELRTAQYRASFDEDTCLRFAKDLVRAKIMNSRTLLRRNWKGPDSSHDTMIELRDDSRRAARARSLSVLLGVEGTGAARYFRAFPSMISEGLRAGGAAFDFEKRNRRPPTDPVNALLSFAYSLLVRAWTVTLAAVGFDPFRGLYHQPRYGRPALALDLMEPFRPLIADSVVVQVINNGEVQPADFRTAAGSVALTAGGRRSLIAAFERRLGHEVVHPLFGYRVSYRRLMEMQARLLGRFLLGEIPAYPNFMTR